MMALLDQRAALIAELEGRIRAAEKQLRVSIDALSTGGVWTPSRKTYSRRPVKEDA